MIQRVAAFTVLGLAFAAGARSAAAQAAAPDGQALYQQNCRSCHGATGTPSERMAGLFPTLKPLTDSDFQAKVSADSIVTVLTHGKGKMKSFAEKLKPEEMAAVAKYVKTLKAAAAGT